MNGTAGKQVDNIWSSLKQGLLSATEKTCGWTKTYGEKKGGGGMKRSVRIYLRREDCGSCGRRVGAKINIWMENRKHIIVENIIRETVNIDEMQFDFSSSRGTTDAIFIIRQLQEKYLMKYRKLYMAFVGLEKAFDRVLSKVLQWALRIVGVPE